MAQSVERFTRNEQANGSIPFTSTTKGSSQSGDPFWQIFSERTAEQCRKNSISFFQLCL